MNRSAFFASIMLFLLVAPSTVSADAVNPNFWNMFINSNGDDPPGYTDNVNLFVNGNRFTSDTIWDAFGHRRGNYEPTTFIFLDNDAGTKDNGDNTIGNGGETVDRLNWELVDTDILTTPRRQLKLISGYQVTLQSDGAANNFNRGTEMFKFMAEGEVDDVFDNNGASGAVLRQFIPQLSRSYEVDLTRTTELGPRLNEIDSVLPADMPFGTVLHVDKIIFNAATLGPEDLETGNEGPGLGTNFVTSSAQVGSKIEDAFGGAISTLEPTNFIFGDNPNGLSDDRDNLLEPGTETMDSVSWKTTEAISIWGYELTLLPDRTPEGARLDNRGADLVAFYVENTLVDLIDFNAYDARLTRYLAKKISGDDFRLEFTRRVGTSGIRLNEVNAIVPEIPSIALTFLAGASVLLLLRLKRPRAAA
jgi:hypothetical protein